MTKNDMPTDPVTNNRDVKEGARGVMQALRRLFDQLGPIRLGSTILFMVLALLVARYSWTTPLIQEAERALYDLRASVFAPEVEKDENIVMVVYNEDTLKLTGQRSPVDRTILAQALETIDAANPKSIGIDILFTMPQDDDPLLISAFENMKTPTYLAYANPKENPEITFAEHEFLQQFFATIRSDKVRPTNIKLETDSDGVQRRWTPHKPGAPPFMAIALTAPNPKFAGNDGAIRYHVPATTDVPVFDRFPIESFADPEIAEMLGSFLAGKHVLIGGDFIDRDRFETPVGGLADIKGDDGKMIGLEVHAHMLAQLLNDDLPTPIPTWTLWIAALIVAICGGLSALIIGNALKVGFILIGQFAFFLIFPFLLQNSGIDTLSLPAFGWAVGWLLGYASVGSAARTVNSKQRAFAQNALGKYLPKSIANEILKDPEKLA
ncbi:MAG: adenylate cyclase, partial [Parasphingorhabdus sp.]